MRLNQYLDISSAVQAALDAGRPVVALESTIISHGMPYPQNVETALRVEDIIRENGAEPATIAVIGGRLKAGLSKEEIDYLGRTGPGVAKASRRDLPVLTAQGQEYAGKTVAPLLSAEEAAFGSLTGEERETLMRLTGKILCKLKEETAGMGLPARETL